MSARPLTLGCVLALLALGSCRQIMNIDDATVDPSLEGDAGGASTMRELVEQGAGAGGAAGGAEAGQAGGQPG